jgi:hypothetical protein
MVNETAARLGSSTGRKGLVALRALQRRFAQRSLTRKTQSAIAAHLPALMRLRLARVTLGPDGKVEAKAWADEVVYFIRNHIQPHLKASERQLLAVEHDRIAWMIADSVEAVARTSPDFYRFAERI